MRRNKEARRREDAAAAIMRTRIKYLHGQRISQRLAKIGERSARIGKMDFGQSAKKSAKNRHKIGKMDFRIRI